MKVYVTKYALTQGILYREVEQSPGYPGWVKPLDWNGPLPDHYGKGEWSSNVDIAMSMAEEMRRKKIKSLRNQIERLENLKVEVHE